MTEQRGGFEISCNNCSKEGFVCIARTPEKFDGYSFVVIRCDGCEQMIAQDPKTGAWSALIAQTIHRGHQGQN